MPWVLDLDGVIWLGDRPIAGAADAVARLRAAGQEVVFATNSTLLRVADQEAKLATMGIDAVGAVVGAATTSAELLDPGMRVLVIGEAGVREAVERRGCEVVVDGAVDAVICGIDRRFDYELLRVAADAVRAGARWIVCNEDVTYPTARGLEPCAGALAAAVTAASGVEPVGGGKPSAAMAAAIHGRLGPDGIVVGDRADTDGRFAQSLGYVFALVLSGVTSEADLPVEPAPALVAPDLATLVTSHLG